MKKIPSESDIPQLFYVEWSGKAYGTNQRLDTNKQGTMYKNKGYGAFQKEVSWYMILAKIRAGGMIKGNVTVRLTFIISKQRDIDSLIKPVLDCLQAAGCIQNDRSIMWLWVRKQIKKSKEPDKIKICVRSMGPRG